MHEDNVLEVRIEFLERVRDILKRQEFICESVSYNDKERREIYRERTREALYRLGTDFKERLNGAPEGVYFLSLCRYEGVGKEADSEKKEA